MDTVIFQAACEVISDIFESLTTGGRRHTHPSEKGVFQNQQVQHTAAKLACHALHTSMEIHTHLVHNN